MRIVNRVVETMETNCTYYRGDAREGKKEPPCRRVDKLVLEVNHRIMKKHFTVLMTLFFLSFTALWMSCKTEEAPKEEVNYHSQVVGQWIDDNNTFWEFYSDGRFVKYVFPSRNAGSKFSFGTWELLRDELTLYEFPYAPHKEEEIPEFYHLEIGGKTMTLSFRNKDYMRVGSQRLQRQKENPWFMEYVEQKINNLPVGYFITFEEFKRQKEIYESYNPILSPTKENLLGQWYVFDFYEEVYNDQYHKLELLPNGELWLIQTIADRGWFWKGIWEYKDNVLSYRITKGALWDSGKGTFELVEGVSTKESSIKLISLRKKSFSYVHGDELVEVKRDIPLHLKKPDYRYPAFDKENELRQFLSQN